MRLDKNGTLYLVTSYSGQTFIGKCAESLTYVELENTVELEDTLELVEQTVMTQHGMAKTKGIATLIPGHNKTMIITTTVSSFIEVPRGSTVETMYNKAKAELSGIHLASPTDLSNIKNTGIIKL